MKCPNCNLIMYKESYTDPSVLYCHHSIGKYGVLIYSDMSVKCYINNWSKILFKIS